MVHIELEPFSDAHRASWWGLLELAGAFPHGWVLVGGQMVLLHAREAGVAPHRTTTDVDVVVDVRVAPRQIAATCTFLQQQGWRGEGPSAMNIAHQFTRSGGIIDVLAPEGLAPSTDLRTFAGGRTIQAPGSRQALGRAEQVTVTVAGRTGTIWRPTLLGALIGKAAALDLPSDTYRHQRDLALLCALVDDPGTIAAAMTRKDRARLRRAAPLLEATHRAWDGLDAAADGIATLHYLLTPVDG